MSACDVLIENASAGAGPALRAVDCLANETAAAAFGRLFGTQGALLPALTILLTLFIAFFAISLLTGRSRLSISALTPRMMTLGVVLTLATSWMAWQGLIWNLAVGAPDQVAGILLGAQGSATQLFADRIDMVFAAITEAGQLNGGGEGAGAAQAAQGSFTPPNLMWLGAVMLLLGTVGILVTARIALAVLMAVGPIFVVMALFSGTRGLTAGWLRGLVLTAVTPLFVVAGGSMILELLVPVVVKLRGAEGIDPRAAMALFLVAAVHIALMAMVMKVSGTIVSAWQVFGLAPSGEGRGNRAETPASSPVVVNAPAATAATHSRTAPIVTAASSDAATSGGSVNSPATHHGGRTVINHVQPGAASGLPPIQPRRARGIGSRFAARPSPMREMMR